jgi:hypothetical protein
MGEKEKKMPEPSPSIRSEWLHRDLQGVVDRIVGLENGRTLIKFAVWPNPSARIEGAEGWCWADAQAVGYSTILPLLLASLNTRKPGVISCTDAPGDETLGVTARVVWFAYSPLPSDPLRATMGG